LKIEIVRIALTSGLPLLVRIF